jgi:hypothetical protein
MAARWRVWVCAAVCLTLAAGCQGPPRYSDDTPIGSNRVAPSRIEAISNNGYGGQGR